MIISHDSKFAVSENHNVIIVYYTALAIHTKAASEPILHILLYVLYQTMSEHPLTFFTGIFLVAYLQAVILFVWSPS